MLFNLGNFTGQLWKFDKYKLQNKEGDWTYKDSEWILPAVGDEGGPIQNSEGMVLTVDDDDKVQLEIKDETFNKQKWEKQDTMDSFFRLNTDGNHLTAATNKILTGIQSRKNIFTPTPKERDRVE